MNTINLIGLILIILVVFFVLIHIIGKVIQKKKKKIGEPNSFILPDKMAKSFKTVDLGIQTESNIILIFLFILGITMFLIYFTFFTENPWLLKGFVIFNGLCGIGMMMVNLVTNYQQLVSYRESTQFIKNFVEAQAQAQVNNHNNVNNHNEKGGIK